MRYFIEFCYDGASFFGYQIQPKQISVQEELERSLSIFLREEIKTTAAGRTDTGVHAKKMFAHFDTLQHLDENLVYRLNSLLPKSISIKRIFPVRDDLHARFSAKYRTYEYHISLQKDPFTTPYAWQYWKRPLDLSAMNEASSMLLEFDDFTSFAKLHADNKTNICTIYQALWVQEGNLLTFHISADRFLRNMVRAIVGTMEEIGAGKIPAEELCHIITKKDRNYAGASAPAQGLFLVDVGYDF